MEMDMEEAELVMEGKERVGVAMEVEEEVRVAGVGETARAHQVKVGALIEVARAQHR